ncbi:MAG: filamentous hemagglutinin N-terminal domain-containing protein [Cyanobacteria bacterium P01_D01_bin.105]
MTRQSRSQSGLSTNYDSFRTGTWLTTITGLITITANPALAQSIAIDGSTSTMLNNGTSCSGNSCSITGGLRSTDNTSNLFHSFSNFNVDTGVTVTFEDPGVTNIFSRVTGNTLTNIDGELKVDGSANLYLLNPNGIVFGNNASLDIPGSFLATTASSILFENNQEFNATNQTTQSLLSVSVPIGLQFGTNSAPITVSGDGHALTYNSRSSTISRTLPSTGLIAASGQTLALLGGSVSLQSGNLVSQNGSIQIGSIGSEETVNLNANSNGWDFDYSEVSNFQDVSLTQQASIDVSGSNAGNVQINAQNISFREGSAIFSKVEDSGDGHIILNASNNISVIGESISTTQPMLTGTFVEIGTNATGNGNSSIIVNANTVDITQTGQIGIGMAGTGTSGVVNVTAETVNVDGGDAANPSLIYAAVLPAYRIGGAALGKGGDLTINAEQLNVTNGAQITTSTFDGGDAGNLTINANDVRVVGRNPSENVTAVSSIRSASEIAPLGFVLNSQTPPTPRFPSVAEGSGNSGSLILNTERLLVSDTAQVGVSTLSNNLGGSLVVNASESVELRGGDSNGRSGLFASALGDRRVPVNSTGTGGSITVNTQQLDVLDGATINVSTSPSASQTSGNAKPSEGTAGNIDINATSVNIKNGSLITADTSAGERANINIQSESVVLREGGQITTNATGTATGGNISLNTEALIAFENSDITANAVDNFGGRIVINSPTIIGTAYREQLTSESDITATSELGPAFSGSVELNSPEVDPTDGTVELPEGLNVEDQIVAACEKIDANTFIATGRGGLPEGSGQISTGQSLWQDFRLLERNNLLSKDNSHNAESALVETNTATRTTEIVEAQGWAIDKNGKVVLGTRTSVATVDHTDTGCLRG